MKMYVLLKMGMSFQRSLCDRLPEGNPLFLGSEGTKMKLRSPRQPLPGTLNIHFKMVVSMG